MIQELELTVLKGIEGSIGKSIREDNKKFEELILVDVGGLVVYGFQERIFWKIKNFFKK